MNAWKERLIGYINALDEAISPEEAEKLNVTEMILIKQEISAKMQEQSKTDVVDNNN